jgi:hypothetical protein
MEDVFIQASFARKGMSSISIDMGTFRLHVQSILISVDSYINSNVLHLFTSNL